MRGKVKPQPAVTLTVRITPAYAGKRTNENLVRLFNKDHPRLCGEKSAMLRRLYPVPGSPPPMRGKVPLVTSIAIVSGITPAYAGKSSRVKSLLEKLRGSPPPMRGKVVMSGGYIGQTRITPAYAGKSNCCNDVRTLWKDHPRLCGEK